ncbi:hypothetical protein BSPLISOX_2787 [uncultured Gammaproteobacteria bacterium]|nr:hypothetical protein [uncultured Gammaproteobacteria bacterium]CAC9451732.1 hypothetical protein [uncultured Gammaproteobacteria bacterium]VVH65036.1 hypothetical protein BSPLISOX_2787 [uncultured Gammaproteobacteria bacterium]
MQWSPEQISGHLKINKNINISHECIYQYILQDKKWQFIDTPTARS